MKKLLIFSLGLVSLGIAVIATVFVSLSSNLPNLITVEDYEPLLVSEVYARGGEKIGEFFREKRILVPYEKIPKNVINAFVAAEDAQFFEHHGINFTAILRAVIANVKAGRKVQGASTITQQVARSLLLTPEKSYVRKIREMILAYRMETHMSKQEIMYLYLNQIYFGQGAYGVAMAAETYFRKPLDKLELSEMAILAGLPKAPSAYSPVYSPESAKRRQRYVLKRMAEDNYVTEKEANEAAEKNVVVYKRQNFKEIAPYYLETIRQLLVAKLGEKEVLDKGLQIYTGLDFEQQVEANTQVQEGLRALDKRQGFRGPLSNLQDPTEIANFLLQERDRLIETLSPQKVILPDGTNPENPPLKLPELPENIASEETAKKNSNNENNLPFYISQGDFVQGIVIDVDDEWGLVKTRFAEGLGLIDFSTMEWARKPNPQLHFLYDKIKKPSEALRKGDVVQLRVIGKKFYSSRIQKRLNELKGRNGKSYQRPLELPDFSNWTEVSLEQEPIAEAALVALDQETDEVLSMVGGYDFARSEFNRAIQSARQTGSSFKAIVYAAALDRGYTAATPIIDAPIVHEEEIKNDLDDEELHVRRWKPNNHSKKFGGDILFRNALIRSLNVPTVKILQDIGVDWVVDYARRLGIFSPLNRDLTLGLGSSGVTLYELTKVFAQFGRLGQRIRPLLIHQVLSQSGDILLEKVSLDQRFEQEIATYEKTFEEKRQAHLELEALKKEERSIEKAEADFAASQVVATDADSENDSSSITQNSTEKPLVHKEPALYFENPDQLIKPQTAYLITSLLQAAVQEGTGRGALPLGRPVAAKTGSTSNYFDGWFLGYTPQVATGVWVGFDQERSLGKSEVGARNALPIWLGYMKKAHENLPEKSFAVPADIIFANIDNETGHLASVNTKSYVRQAFLDGTEPKESGESLIEEETNFYKEDLSE